MDGPGGGSDRNDESMKQGNENDKYGTKGYDDSGIKRFSIDARGKIHRYGGTAVIPRGQKMFIAMGWVSAALAAFISPYFAILGIIFGLLANKQLKGSGNAVIISNIVLAVINLILGFIFGLFLIGSLRRMVF